MKHSALIVVTLVMTFSGVLYGEPPAPKPVFPELNAARLVGWQLASVIINKLETDDQTDFPGTTAWLKDLRRMTKGVDLKVAPDKWPEFDVDALLSRNPNFWQAHYEVLPGDPGLTFLHSGLLLTAGEANRAGQVILLAAQRPRVPQQFRQAFELILSHSQEVAKKPHALVYEGIKLFDKHDYEAALKKYRAALEMWPQDSFAHFEVGLTLMHQEMIAAGITPPPLNAVIVDPKYKYKHGPEVVAEFAAARKHNPFQIKAYQGRDPEVNQGFVVLAKKGLPIWDKLLKDWKKPITDAELEQFASAYQEAKVHELALVARQILIARRKNYAPEDHPFMSTSLTALVPGEQTERVLSLLADGPLKVHQLLAVEPESP